MRRPVAHRSAEGEQLGACRDVARGVVGRHREHAGQPLLAAQSLAQRGAWLERDGHGLAGVAAGHPEPGESPELAARGPVSAAREAAGERGSQADGLVDPDAEFQPGAAQALDLLAVFGEQLDERRCLVGPCAGAARAAWAAWAAEHALEADLAREREAVEGVGVTDPDRPCAWIELPRLARLVPVLERALVQMDRHPPARPWGQFDALEPAQRTHRLLGARDLRSTTDVDLRDLGAGA